MESFSFMPHLHCYLGNPFLIWGMFTTDLLIVLSYFGIPPEQTNRIFEMFVQADNSMTRKFGGTGFGLVPHLEAGAQRLVVNSEVLPG